MNKENSDYKKRGRKKGTFGLHSGQVSDEAIEGLAADHCTNDEIAAVLGICPKTLKERYEKLIEKGRLRGHTSLRRLQWESAKSGNVTMQIFLGKVLLKQKDDSSGSNQNLIIQKIERPYHEEKDTNSE